MAFSDGEEYLVAAERDFFGEFVRAFVRDEEIVVDVRLELVAKHEADTGICLFKFLYRLGNGAAVAENEESYLAAELVCAAGRLLLCLVENIERQLYLIVKAFSCIGKYDLVCAVLKELYTELSFESFYRL